MTAALRITADPLHTLALNIIARGVMAVPTFARPYYTAAEWIRAAHYLLDTGDVSELEYMLERPE